MTELQEFQEALGAFVQEWWGQIEYEPDPERGDARLPPLPDLRPSRDRYVADVFRQLRRAEEDLQWAIEAEVA